MRARRGTLAGLPALLAALALGCAAGPAPPPASGGLFGEVPSEGNTLAGTWTATVGPNSTGAATGYWQLHLGADGSLMLRQDGRTIYEGVYTAEGRELRIDNEQGITGCTRMSALYHWAVSGNTLELRPRTERCQSVGRVLQTARWQRR